MATREHRHDARDHGKWCGYCKTPWVEAANNASKRYSDDDVLYEYTVDMRELVIGVDSAVNQAVAV